MLEALNIKNFAIIEDIEINFKSGMNVMLGETGAGKSIIIDALSLLKGERSSYDKIRVGASKAYIDGRFIIENKELIKQINEEYDDLIENDELIVSRSLDINGRTSIKLNGRMFSSSVTKLIMNEIIDIHSQHQNLLLQKEDFQLNVVDILAQDAEHIKAYQAVYQQYRSALSRLEQQKQELIKNRENEEFMRFQHKELDEAHLEPGELEQLEQESDILNHSEEIKSALYEADHSLSDDEGSILQLLRNASYSISNIREIYPEVAELSDRLDSSYIELKDIAQEISSSLDRIDFDPARLEQLNTRLDQLNTLLQKFHVETVEELIETRDLLAQQLEHIDNGNEDIEILQKEVDQKLIKAMSAAHSLSSLRKKVAKSIETEMKNRLVPLGIPNVRFEIEFAEKPLCRDGADKVSFLFSANRSTPLQPISQVASGGEIARVMLSLKAMISGAVKLPTIIFDEIDTGVSGKIAEKMAEIMTEMGNQNRQVISITHLPQIAAMGSHHYKVMKEETQTGTISQMRELTPAQRVEEIAQMLSGSDISQAALANAKELINKHAKL